MTETVEYALVVMASSLFVAGSVLTYGSFSAFESGIQFRAEVQAVSTLASTALVNGSSRATLSLPPSTISCRSETLTITSGSMNESKDIGFPCDFSVSAPQGSHVVAFEVRGSSLNLAVL